jgi:hypothetical protein
LNVALVKIEGTLNDGGVITITCFPPAALLTINSSCSHITLCVIVAIVETPLFV